jgi:hypothetical protein
VVLKCAIVNPDVGGKAGEAQIGHMLALPNWNNDAVDIVWHGSFLGFSMRRRVAYRPFAPGLRGHWVLRKMKLE